MTVLEEIDLVDDVDQDWIDDRSEVEFERRGFRRRQDSCE